ncbi:MAG: YbjQ family protein [Gemmataceae bacterium]
MLELLISVGGFLLLLGLGFCVGGSRERRHLRQLEQREREQSDCLITQLKTFPGAATADAPACLLVAEVVIASDFLKSFLASMRGIFGGEVRSYRTLMDRARREAVLRVVEQARALGYNAVCNIRLQTADIGGGTATQKFPIVAILASGTAYHATVKTS